jgi:Cof subfamily protein (haloacid dehalogenase superfamily)
VASPIRLLVSDIDGTLITSDKTLTDRTVDAVHQLGAAGIQFAMTSSRPPPGLAMYATPLGVATPLGAYNGGAFCDPVTLAVIAQRSIPEGAVADLVSIIEASGLQAWVYRDGAWLVRDVNAWHVQHEAEVVQFTPTPVDDFGDLHGADAADVVKVVGVSQDHDAVERVEAAIRSRLGTMVSATRSQAYYVDVTNPDANKGAVIDYFSEHLGVPHDAIAAIGDGQNDTLMFAKVGLSIAMGNCEPEVRQVAKVTTAGNDDEGFARAVAQYLLA